MELKRRSERYWMRNRDGMSLKRRGERYWMRNRDGMSLKRRGERYWMRNRDGMVLKRRGERDWMRNRDGMAFKRRGERYWMKSRDWIELSVREEKILFLDSIKPYEVLQTQMYAIRRLFILPAPETQGELDIHSKWFLINDQSIVIGDYLHSDGLRTLVCSTNECLEILSRAETIHGKNFLF